MLEFFTSSSQRIKNQPWEHILGKLLQRIHGLLEVWVQGTKDLKLVDSIKGPKLEVWFLKLSGVICQVEIDEV